MKTQYPWGSGGQIMAWHGLLGERDWNRPFNITLGEHYLGFHVQDQHNHYIWFQLEVDGKLYFYLPGCGRDAFTAWGSSIILNDVLSAVLQADDIQLVLKAAFTGPYHFQWRCSLLNQGNDNHQVQLKVFAAASHPGESSPHQRTFKNEEIQSRLGFRQASGSPDGYLHYCGEHGIFTQELEAASTMDVDGWYELRYDEDSFENPAAVDWATLEGERLRAYDVLKFSRDGSSYGPAAVKALSILRVNTCSAQEKIPCLWTTPERVPHRRMWLWDSAWHAMGMAVIDPAWAWDTLRAVFALQAEDGAIFHMMEPNGHTSGITQPPVLAWAVQDLLQFGGNAADFAAEVYDVLCRYLDWNVANRDRNSNGLMDWLHADESGMDDSPRHDRGMDYDAIDFNSFMVREYQAMQEMSILLGYDPDPWKEREIQLTSAINEYLWNDEQQCYMDRYFDGSWSKCISVAGFTPLVAGIVPDERLPEVLSLLQDPQHFWTRQPVSSISCKQAEYSTMYWRGPTWVNYNYLMICGLRRYDKQELADQLTTHTLDMVADAYSQTGNIWEFYDAEGTSISEDLYTRWDPRQDQFRCRKDFSWSAALYLRLLHEQKMLLQKS